MAEPRVVVLTGASAGIGAAAARALRSAGHEVVLIGRSPERTGAVAKELGARHYLVDFEEAMNVRDLAARLLTDLPRIDVLALNAGAMYAERRRTVDGHERTWQTNVLAPTLLGRLLMPRLRESGGRMILTSSSAYRFARLDMSDLEGHRSVYSMLRAYGAAKLAGLIILDEASKRREVAGVTLAAFHPGFTATEMLRDTPVIRSVVNSPLARNVAIPPEEGALPLAYLATEPDTELIHGSYWHRMRERRIRHPQWGDVQLRAAVKEAVDAFDTAIV